MNITFMLKLLDGTSETCVLSLAFGSDTPIPIAVMRIDELWKNDTAKDFYHAVADGKVLRMSIPARNVEIGE